LKLAALMSVLDYKGKQIKFPDSMSRDEIQAIIKVMESPGTYAKLKSDGDRTSAHMDKLTEVAKAMEANESSTTGFLEMLVRCMAEAQQHQAALLKALAPSTTEVILNAPESRPVAYTFTVMRDNDGQMTSVDATPKVAI
jgi:hypothetical protein